MSEAASWLNSLQKLNPQVGGLNKPINISALCPQIYEEFIRNAIERQTIKTFLK